MSKENLTIKEIFDLAVQKHQSNNLQDAQNYYQKVLELDPNYVSALNNLGVIFQGLGENKKAKDCYEKVVEINPNRVEVHNNLGVLSLLAGKIKRAKECYEKAIEINPNYADAHHNLGVIFQKLGEYHKAKECYEKAIEINPNRVEAHNNLGNIYYNLGELQKAKNCYDKAIEINPNYADALNNLGVTFKELGENQKAKDCYEKAIEIDPKYADAHNNLGNIYYNLGELQKAKDCYEKAIEINPDLFDASANVANIYVGQLTDFEIAISKSNEALKIYHKSYKFINQSVSLFKLKHDLQQANYLNSKNYKINGINEFIKIGDQILRREENKEEKNDVNKKILLNNDEINTLLLYSKENHTYQTKTISGSCINPNKNWLDVEDEYLNSNNQIIYIDDFLSDETLIELREFCLVSKVWHKEYHNKYLGAFSNSGFISPIHLQIAVDLQQKLPRLFGAHKLGMFWGFKYDSILGKGINIHADFAIHNLNFWITPDKYNNDKNSGGLKVYDVPAPDNWTAQDYNNNSNKIYKFLKENSANCVNIPYKFNRAVLFNSAYFHETDEINFKNKYEGRRINNTYLFGGRLVKQSLC
ncbi:tetratricopeptide repeat protein [Candidatus Pelagibacter sp.]|nr:tetratricopeptide repeat protein [Candidatus Pelagibacter sp.]